MSQMRAQDIANALLPGLGYVLATLIVLGGLAFNVGNVAGAGLGVSVVATTAPPAFTFSSASCSVGCSFAQRSFASSPAW